MKKILIALLLLAGSAHADETRAQAIKSLMGLGMPGALATEVAQLATGNASINQSLKPDTDNTLDLGSALKQWRNGYFGTNLVFGAASAKIIPGATSFLFRNNADNATNLTITDAGAVTSRSTITSGGDITFSGADQSINGGSTNVRLKINGNLQHNYTDGKDNLGIAAYKIVPGATSFSFRNNADTQDNLIISDAGNWKSTNTNVGWAVRAGANTACNTTCTANHGCLFGYDIGTTAVVDCSSALADSCVCSF